MLVPGPWRDAEQTTQAIANRDRSLLESVSLSLIQDSQLATGFAWGRRGPLAEDLLARVRKCAQAALVEFHGRLDEHASQVAALGRALRDAGGVAVRMEASGAASPWEPWLEQLESRDLSQIYESAVLVVHDTDETLFTCGMHHFDLPDAQIATARPAEALAWLDAFCVFQLTEHPGLASGHTFRPDNDTPRRTFERWPDHRHHPNDGRHNPFGIWRLLEPKTSGVEAGRLVPTIIPSLVAILVAAERSAGRPLSRREVEQLVDNTPAVAMDPRDVQALERSRGYADIEPSLAWEQWKIVRNQSDQSTR